MLTGTVLWFNVEGGYGFIKQDSSDISVFVGYTDIVANGFKVLYEGDKVQFDIAEQDIRGVPRAINVARL